MTSIKAKKQRLHYAMCQAMHKTKLGLAMPLALVMVLVMVLGAAQAKSDPPHNEVLAPDIQAAETVAKTAVQNLEKYRAEIDALIRGTPSFADSQQTLGISTPHDDARGIKSFGQDKAINQSTLMVFLTLSMPDDALAGWLEQTARAGGVAVIRGFHGDKLSATIKRLTALQAQAPATKTRGGVSIDPTAFTRFDVDVAPSVIVSDAALPPCKTRGCVGDAAPAHDRIAGNITLAHALGLLTRHGDQAPQVAKRHLHQLQAKEDRP